MSSPFYEPVSQKSAANEKVQTSSSVDVQFVDTRCGFGMWKPGYMQPLATIGAFTACFSFASLMTQTLMNYVSSQVTTLERQFGFSSRQTGLILAANDIGYLVCVLFVSYTANRIHIPRSLGIMIAMSIMGPVAAFLVGGVFSRMYVTLEATKLTPRHPKWIGAWWLGFVVFGALSLIVSIPLFCFPRKLPRIKTKEIHVDDDKMAGETEKNDDLKALVHLHTPVKQSNKDTTRTSHTGHIFRGMRFKSLLKHVREFLAVLYRLVTNPVYVCMVVSGCFYIFTYAGDNAFFPKYLERMFHLPIHTSNYITAGIYLCTSCVGSFTGGVLSRRFKLTAITALKVTIILTTAAIGVHLLAFIFQCEQPTVYNWPGEENACNSGCNCRDNSYFPICGGDGRTYYSPCHAGCPQTGLGLYQNCSCIPGGQAKAGTCDYGCPYLYAYVITVGVRCMFTTLIIIPQVIIYMRCVPEEDRAMSLSVSQFTTSLFGWLLAPILFGNIIDSTCLIWDIKCLTRGRCLHYDNNQFRVKFLGYEALGLAGTALFVLAAYLYARRTGCLDSAAQHQIAQENPETKPVANDDGTVNA